MKANIDINIYEANDEIFKEQLKQNLSKGEDEWPERANDQKVLVKFKLNNNNYVTVVSNQDALNSIFKRDPNIATSAKYYIVQNEEALNENLTKLDQVELIDLFPDKPSRSSLTRSSMMGPPSNGTETDPLLEKEIQEDNSEASCCCTVS